ncbi:MAG: hypothetical protein ABI145_01400 [Steroidobacteraceae bacterium]
MKNVVNELKIQQHDGEQNVSNWTEMLERLPEELGHALINQRAGMEQVVYNRLY